MFLLFCFLLGAICFWRGIWPLRIDRRIKLALLLPVMLLAFNFAVRKFWGIEDAPIGISLAVAWGFSSLVLYDYALIGYEAIYWCVRGICRWRKMEFPPVLHRDVLRKWLLLPVVVLTSLGMYFALRMPQVKHYELEFSGLPATADGMRIAVLADIHVDRITDGKRVEEIVRRTNSLHPDLTVVLGDIVDRRVDVISDDLTALGKLQARYGVYGVPGNHEYYSGYRKWQEFFRKIGLEMLENRHVLIAGNSIALGGVTDLAAPRVGMTGPDVRKTFSGVPADNFKILLAHQPKVAALAAPEKVDLQLSGHTHGGLMPGVDIFIACFNYGMVSGEYDYHGMRVFISNGTGVWGGMPVRLCRNSEIVLLTLKRKK